MLLRRLPTARLQSHFDIASVTVRCCALSRCRAPVCNRILTLSANVKPRALALTRSLLLCAALPTTVIRMRRRRRRSVLRAHVRLGRSALRRRVWLAAGMSCDRPFAAFWGTSTQVRPFSTASNTIFLNIRSVLSCKVNGSCSPLMINWVVADTV